MLWESSCCWLLKEQGSKNKQGGQEGDCGRERPTDDGASNQGQPSGAGELVRFRRTIEGRADRTV